MRWLITIGCLLWALAARADEPQAWLGVETRAPVHEGVSWVPDHARLISQVRLGGPLGGLTYVLVRAGPMWKFNDFLAFNFNGTLALSEREPDQFVPDRRLELEPIVSYRLGPVAASLRDRLERRWLGQETQWRNRVRLQLALARDTFWQPYVSDEAFTVVGGAGFNENRLIAGIAWKLRRVQLETAYLFRAQKGSAGWSYENILSLSLLFQPSLQETGVPGSAGDR